jgi:hypothetical protein
VSHFADFALLASIPSYGGAEILRTVRVGPMGPGPRAHLALFGRSEVIARRVVSVAMAASGVQHPALARIHEVAVFDGVVFGVGDAAEGVDVSSVLASEKARRKAPPLEVGVGVVLSLEVERRPDGHKHGDLGFEVTRLELPLRTRPGLCTRPLGQCGKRVGVPVRLYVSLHGWNRLTHSHHQAEQPTCKGRRCRQREERRPRFEKTPPRIHATPEGAKHRAYSQGRNRIRRPVHRKVVACQPDERAKRSGQHSRPSVERSGAKGEACKELRVCRWKRKIHFPRDVARLDLQSGFVTGRIPAGPRALHCPLQRRVHQISSADERYQRCAER